MKEPITDYAAVKTAITEKLARYFGVVPEDATKEQMYRATIYTVKDILAQKRADFKESLKKQRPRTVYYLCMEFLIGRSLKNNLLNLGLEDVYRGVVEEFGFHLDALYDMEPDPGLGNGGLGRLAACFMDSLTTLAYPAMGFSLCYEYGLFRQKIIDGNQIELPDEWLTHGDAWLVPRTDRSVTVRMGGHVTEDWSSGRCAVTYTEYEEVQAVPYDFFVSGFDSPAVNKLRLWRARSSSNFDMSLFSQGQYVQALERNVGAELITKVLYPSDAHDEGKLLRLTQQYFLVSATLQSIIAEHLSQYGSLDSFADKVAIHINDTHPALCIPELMRILMDVYSYRWEDAWSVVTRVISYTNHTVLPEALETWNMDLFRLKLPRIFMIVEEINRRLCADLWNMYPGDWARISRMSIVAYNQIRMANLSVAAAHVVNGVSRLHSEILRQTVFSDFAKASPGKFINVTNGIAHRRWLCWSNPGLSALLEETIGSEYKKDPQTLLQFLSYQDDREVIDRLHVIKQQNKERFAAELYRLKGIRIDPATLFDVQVKRMHEYKRQLLNALKIIAYIHTLRCDPHADIEPTTFLFGGKAAPGYYMAKDIIRLIWSIGDEIEHDPRLRDRIRVVYLEDYNVSTAEILMPASDISEQISLAGKEASGTGCMKFMINGALTLGTMDGANVEMAEAVGSENIYIFGLRAQEVDSLWKEGYSSLRYYQRSDRLRAVIDMLGRGFAGNSFEPIVNYLLYAHGVSDPYMCLADFDSYFAANECMRAAHQDPVSWSRKALINIAHAGHFSSDRCIREYADAIWHIRPIQ